MSGKLYYLGHNATDHTLTFAYGTRRYEYQMPNPQACEDVIYIIRKVSIGKAFALAKRRGKLLEPSHAMC